MATSIELLKSSSSMRALAYRPRIASASSIRFSPPSARGPASDSHSPTKSSAPMTGRLRSHQAQVKEANLPFFYPRLRKFNDHSEGNCHSGRRSDDALSSRRGLEERGI